MTAASNLPIDALAQRCADETQKYRRNQPSDPQYCFELLRRALAEDLPEAFARTYRIYEQQVLAWVYSHGRFHQVDESAEFFAGWALRSFYFGVRGPKFASFPSLAHLLAYLKSCVHTAITQYLRDRLPAPGVSLATVGEPSREVDLGEGVAAAELWDHIAGLLPDERDRLLAHCTFALGMKPRQIRAAYPQRWRDEREISVALFRIRSLLRGDAELRRRVGLAEEGGPA
jgi:hypothetical protein